MGQGLGQFSVVAKDEKAFRIEIEASYVSQMMKAWWDQYVNGGAVVLILPGANQSGRFVEDDGLHLQRLEAFPRGANEIAGENARPGVQANFAIHTDFTSLHERVARPTRPNTAGGEVFVETNPVRAVHGMKKAEPQKGSADQKIDGEERRLASSLSFWQADGALTFFPFATLFHHFDALEALHD